MKNAIPLLLIYFFIGKSYATEQVPDLLVYNKDTVYIYSNPLQEKEHLLTKDNRFLKLSCSSTACWRRYQATWELIDDKLYLTKVSSCCNPNITADLNLIFKEEISDQKVLATWYTGKIVVPIGEKLFGKHMGYSNVHQYEDILEVTNGIKNKTTRVDNTKTRITYLRSDKLVIELIKKLDKNILEKIWKKEFGLRFYVDIKTDENRHVTQVEFELIKEIRHKKEILKIINGIKDWDILYRHGEKVDLSWYYPVVINKKKLKEYKKYWR